MEAFSSTSRISRDQKCNISPETTFAPHTRQGTKLRDILMSDKSNLSYADFHHAITRNSDDALPKYVGVGCQQWRVSDRRICKEDELSGTCHTYQVI